MNPIVTILTPCYNGEKYLPNFLKSILNQSYNKIELIFINDGSTDNTEKIFMEYKPKLEQKGIKVIYQYQTNQGQAAAINNGLKLVTGDYLMWPDSDDILTTDAIEVKLNFLLQNPEYKFVRTDGLVFKEDDLNNSIERISGDKKNRFDEELFDSLINSETFIACGCYMVETKAFLKVNPKREIYCSKGGQNWQMFLPIAYKYKCKYLDINTYNYIVHDDSHSHREGDDIIRVKRYEDILLNTINKIDMPSTEKQKYLKRIKLKYSRQMLGMSRRVSNKELFLENYKYLKKVKKLPVVYRFYKIFKKW